MLPSLYQSLNIKIRPCICSCISTLKYHNSHIKYAPTRSSAMFTPDEESKIIQTINTSSVDDLQQYNIRSTELKKLLSYREKNGQFQTFDDILLTQHVPSLIKLCKSILSGEKKPPRKTKPPAAPKSLITPAIDETTKNNIHKKLGIYVAGDRLCWAMIDENENLSHWNYKTFEIPSKSSSVATINSIIEIISTLPQADAYVMECDQYTSLNKLNPAAYFIHLQRQLIITTIISVLGMRNRSSNDNIPVINNFYTIPARASARRYGLIVGSEKISGESVINNILKQSDKNNELISIDPEVILQYSSQDLEAREQLNTVLLITLTFIELMNKTLVKIKAKN